MSTVPSQVSRWLRTRSGRWRKQSIPSIHKGLSFHNPSFCEETGSGVKTDSNVLHCLACKAETRFSRVDAETTFHCDLCNAQLLNYEGASRVVLQCTSCSFSVCAEPLDNLSSTTCYDTYYSVDVWKECLYGDNTNLDDIEDRRKYVRCLCIDAQSNQDKFVEELHIKLGIDSISDFGPNKPELLKNWHSTSDLIIVGVYAFSSEKIKQLVTMALKDASEINAALSASVRSCSTQKAFTWLLEQLNGEPVNLQVLYVACERGFLHAVEALLQHPGVNPASEQNFAICLASEHGHLDIVSLLMDDGRVDPSDPSNCSLIKASENGHIGVVCRLLEDDRVNPGAIDNFAIRLASGNGYIDVVNRLLKEDAVDPSGLCNSAIVDACEFGHLDVVNRLLEDERVDPCETGNAALGMACANGHVDVVKRLLEDRRIDVSDDQNYALRAACANGKLGIVNILLDADDKRVDPSGSENSAIILASTHGHVDVVKRLLRDQRVDPSGGGNLAIVDASRNGHYEVVDTLLQDSRIDPNDRFNWALVSACKNEFFRIVNRLLEDERTNPAAGDNMAIQVASEVGNLVIIRRLLQDSRVEPPIQALYVAKDFDVQDLLIVRIRNKLSFDSTPHLERVLCNFHKRNTLLALWILLQVEVIGSVSTKTMIPKELLLLIAHDWVLPIYSPRVTEDPELKRKRMSN